MKKQKLDFNICLFINKRSIAALIFGAAIFFYACDNDLEKIKAFSSTENLPILEAYNFETLFTDSGQIRYSVKTEKLLRFENEGNAFHEFPDGVEIVQFDSKGRIVSSLTADYAKQFIKEEKWVAKNNVVATNEKGDTLKTEHLIWEEKTEKIYTDEFVEIVREDGIYTGIGLTADEALQKWRIKKLKGITYIEVDEKNTAQPGAKNTKREKINPDIKDRKNKPFDRPLIFKNK